MRQHFEANLKSIHDYTIDVLNRSVECLVTHGAAKYAAHWNADTVEDYLHLLATDEQIKIEAARLTTDSTMRLIVEDTLRGIVRIMAHVAQDQEAPTLHE